MSERSQYESATSAYTGARPLAQEFLVLLRLTAEYVEAAERLINALIGRLGTKDPNEALLEMERVIDAYAEAQGALKTFAEARARVLS